MSTFQKKMNRRTFLKYSAAATSAAYLGLGQSFAVTPPRGKKADLVLWDGKILTVDPIDSIKQSVAIKGDRILDVGFNEDINPYIGPETEVVDLQGKIVTPGLVDSHIHVLFYGRVFWDGFLNIRYPAVKSTQELLQAVAERAATLDPNYPEVWISGNQGFPGQGIDFNRHDIDEVALGHPVYLRHGSGQFSVANTRALIRSGITECITNPAGVVCEDEKPTGLLLQYPAENLVLTHADGWANLSDDDLENDIKVAQEKCLAAGITSGQDVIVGELRHINIYKKLAENGELKMRMYLLLYVQSLDQLEEYRKHKDELKEYRKYKSDYFTFAGWKLAVDGGAAARTALMYNEKLAAAANYSPDLFFKPGELIRIVKLLHKTGLQIAFHICGDKGIDEALLALYLAMKARSRNDPRHRIEHAIWATPESLDRIKQLGVVVSIQPQWISQYAKEYRDLSDDDTMENFIQIKSMLRKGIPLAFGSDVPASITHQPRFGFYGAITRTTLDEKPYTPDPDECIKIQQALRIYTMGSAYAAFEENKKGSIEAGKLADLVVWPQDLYTIEPQVFIDEEDKLEALMTIVGGKIVYEKK